MEKNIKPMFMEGFITNLKFYSIILFLIKKIKLQFLSVRDFIPPISATLPILEIVLQYKIR